MKDTDLAYFAGIIDGEGTVTLSHSSNHTWRAPTVTFPSTSPELISAFKRLFGGTVVRKKVYKAHHKESWECRLRYNQALSALTLIRPYLLHKEKIRRSDLILTTYKSVTPRNGKYTEKQTATKQAFEDAFFQSV